MASPFRTFRKNQKAWMVGLTIMTMFAFVFLGQVAGNRSSSSSEYKDPEIFTWKYGTVRKHDLDERLYTRRIANRFLQNAILAAELPRQATEYLLNMSLFSTSESQVVFDMLLEKKAQQLGIIVSDRVINNYIREVTLDRVSAQKLADVGRNLSGSGSQVSQAQIFDALRSALTARYAYQTFAGFLMRTDGQRAVFNGDTPGDRWEYFCQLNRKVTAEILPVSVEKFVAEIPDPSADELRKFYDLYKNDYPNPYSPTPGFKRPFRAQFQYVKADYDKKLKEEMAKITDEEIAEYYEKNKDDFKKSKLPDLLERPLDAPLPKSETTPDESGKGATEGKSPDTKSDAESDAKADAKSGESKSGSKAKDDKSSDTKSGAAKDAAGKSDAKGAAPKSGESKKSGDAKKSSMNRSLDGEQLAMADDAAVLLAQASSAAPKSSPKSAPKADAKSDTSGAKSSKSASTADKAKDTAASKDTAPTDTAAKTDDTQTKDATGADGKTADAKSADDKSASTTERPVEYQPLEEVKEKIRERIADKKIHDNRIAAFSAIKQLMSNYRRDRENYDSKIKQGMTTAKKPEAPTPEFLADPKYEAGLEGHTTELVSPSEIESSDLGRSYRGPTAQNYSTIPFLRIGFQEPSKNSRGLPLYQVDQSQDNDQNEYLWWKIDEKPAEVPKLEDIKDEVVRAWKTIQARKPAKAKAEADAELARKEKKSLKELLGDSQGEVSTAGPFSWYSRLPAQLYEPLPKITLTKISGVEQAGTDFMKTIFALKEGQTGIAANLPENVYYVVQIESEEPGLDKLHDEFLADMSNPMAAQVYAVVGATDNAGQGLAWLNELKDEFGYKLAPGQTLSESATME
jgi:hypothetical protein